MFQPPRILVDALNRALLILALVAGLISLFFAYGTVPRLICTGVLAACILLAVFRLFSANRARRAQENQRFLTMTTAVREFFRRPRSAKTARAPRERRAQKSHLERDQALQIPHLPTVHAAAARAARQGPADRHLHALRQPV